MAKKKVTPTKAKKDHVPIGIADGAVRSPYSDLSLMTELPYANLILGIMEELGQDCEDLAQRIHELNAVLGYDHSEHVYGDDRVRETNEALLVAEKLLHNAYCVIYDGDAVDRRYATTSAYNLYCRGIFPGEKAVPHAS